MKYFKIDFSNYYDIGRIPSRAEGEKISNANYYFYEIRKGKLLLDAPVFDHFYLKSFDKKKYWEWKLNDVHRFIGEGSQLSPCWLISLDLKLLLENFNLSKPYHFYHSKLLYKGNKLDYYIFQFTGSLTYKQILDYVNYPMSIFWDPVKKINIKVNSMDSFLSEYDRVSDENRGINNIIQNKKLVLKEELDFFPMDSLSMGTLVSERLKTAIEEMGITGFEFSEVDYEVMAE